MDTTSITLQDGTIMQVPVRTELQIDKEYDNGLTLASHLDSEYAIILLGGQPQSREEDFERGISHLNLLLLKNYWGLRDMTAIEDTAALTLAPK